MKEEKSDKLRELKTNLDKHIKQVKGKEIEKSKPVFDKDKFLEEMEKNKSTNKGGLNPTEAQESEQYLEKRINELEQRIQKLESFIFQEFTKGGSQT